jgi:hypothetical protein
MKPFLKDLAEKMIAIHPRMDHLTFVFPNRRAALYFQNYLSLALTQPQWAPQMVSIEEYFKKQSDLLEPDRLTLIFRLYSVYSDILKSDESFDRFYFWGDMLLRDFDEIDKYLVNAPQLFTDLSKIKELDETFDYLTDEQKRFLQNFWVHFEEKPSFSKEQFLRMWKQLPEVYIKFTKSLKKDHLGYEGMIHRDVAERFQKGKSLDQDYSSLVFAGFNALTRAEETLMAATVTKGARVFWDADAYYVEDVVQEAGQFLRSYRNHPVLGKTFDKDLPPMIRQPKQVDVTGVPQRIGQAKLVGQEIRQVLSSLSGENLPMELSRTVIVLPDESMLLPLMHSMPEELQDINVTMGFPLRFTPLFSLIDLIIEMQLKRRGESFSHREVNAILGHPYVLALGGEAARSAQSEIIRKNRVFAQIRDLQKGEHIFSLIFTRADPENATDYLLEIIRFLGASFSDKRTFDREYAYHFHQQVSRLHAILKGTSRSPDWRGFQKLWRQVVLSLRVPFYGEPLRGLQIMGMLETRNLDFDNVFFLSANEGLLPASGRQGSYVPHAIRKAYGLPTFEQQDATYAYLFYRLLQRSQRVSFYYNTEPDVVGNGELSRFVQQVLHESGLEIKRKVLHNEVHVRGVENFEMPKTPLVLGLLEKYIKEDPTREQQQRLTPSNLNDFVECSLRFYLRHIARLTEVEEVEEDVDARNFGNILHGVAHWFYEDLLRSGRSSITEEDFENTDEVVDKLIDRAFREHYHLDADTPVVYEGQRVVVKAVAKTFIDKILEKDRAYAPFEIRMLEAPFGELITLADGRKVRIGGKIDRADWKDGTVRVIDYKTGKDDLNFESIESLFNHNQGRNKAAFQTILYAYVYCLMNGKANDRVKPGLMNRKNLFDKFEFGHKMGIGSRAQAIEDVRPLLVEFGHRLQSLVEELYDPAVPFKQTTELKTCQWCAYKAFCRR